MKNFCNFTVLGIDGSKFQLPESNQLKLRYGGTSNQTDISMNMAQGSQLVDVINGIVLHALLTPYSTCERKLANIHINLLVELKEKIPHLANSIMLFDRGYPSVLLIAKLYYNNIQYLMRSSKGFLKLINDFVDSGELDGIIAISLKKMAKSEKEEILKECPGLDLNQDILVRVIIVTLNNGEKEILLTSLLDNKKYNYKKFKEFYSLRWGAETIYGLEKIRWEIENFSGKSQIAVEQDYFATILNFNMTTVLALEAKKELDKSKDIVHREYEYEINYSIALAYMKNRFMRALLDLNIQPKNFCLEIKKLMKKNLEPIRLGRTFKHKRKYPGKRFPTNTRAVI